MAEYIERERFMHHLEMCIDNVRNTNGVTEDFEICLRALKNQPTADVAEVRHGEWIPCGDGEHTPLMCSSCLNTWGFYKKRGSNYCPRCGAKMDKE